MTYADYEFYSETYLGTAIAPADFLRLAERASEAIDLVTFDRAGPVVTADEDADTIVLIQKATCAVAEALQEIEEKPVASERVGQHSVTYVTGPVLTDDQKVIRAAKRYLGPTGLMYRGF